MQHSNRKHTQILVYRALIVALIILQTLVPMLGFISFGPISMTIIPITVIITTLWLDRQSALIAGLTFGLASFTRTWLIGNPVERLIFTNPLISVLPRVLMPLILSYIVSYLYRKKLSDTAVATIGGFLGAFLNTVLVLGAMYLFGGSNILSAYGVGTKRELAIILAGIVAANGIAEWVVTTILTPILFKPLTRIRPIYYKEDFHVK